LDVVTASCRYSYSEQAAAIMYVALRAFNKEDSYPDTLMRHAFQTKESILHVAKEVVNLVAESRTNTLQAVVKKYSTTKFMEAAKIEPPMAVLQES
jgi:cyclin B